MSYPEQEWTPQVPAARPRPQLAVVTWSIIAVCLAVWLAEISIPGFFELVALSPAVGLLEPWRLMTSAFAHAISPMHVAMNMFALWQVGRPLELALGRARYAALYLLSALGGSVGFIVLAMPPSDAHPYGVNWFTAVVGASGAVFGLFGALLLLMKRMGGDIRQMAALVAVNAALPLFIPGIAWQAHAGGFLTGVAVGWVLSRGAERIRKGLPDRMTGGLAIIAAVLVLLVIGRYMLV